MDATLFFWRFQRNFQQISIFEFHKVVRQQYQGVVGNIIWILFSGEFSLQQ